MSRYNSLSIHFYIFFVSGWLCMNPEKSELILFRKGRKNMMLYVERQEEADKIKFFGFTIDMGYTFSNHATQGAANVNHKVEKLPNILKFVDFKNKLAVTETNVISTDTYCLPVWDYKYGLKMLNWLNMDNTWRLERVLAM